MSLVQFAIAEDPPNRLDKALFRVAPEQEDLSRTRLGKLIEEGAVRVDGKIATSPKSKVAAGAVIEITLSALEYMNRTPVSKSTPLLLTATVTVPVPLAGSVHTTLDVDTKRATEV